LGIVAVGCTVQRVPLKDPAKSGRGAPYDFEKEGTIPPPPRVEPAPASGRLDSGATLETPQAAQLDAPAVVVQDLSPPATVSPTPPVVVASVATPAPAAAPSASGASVETPTEASGARLASGYRVQVFAGARDPALQLRSEIQVRLGERVYVDYVAPYYKVRVGNCRTSEACRALESRLRQEGYGTIWTVPAQIEP
jgi:hypothetical protein